MPQIQRTTFNKVIDKIEKKNANKIVQRIFLTDRLKNENNAPSNRR